MEYLKLVVDAWPMLWVLPMLFGMLTCVVALNQIQDRRALVAVRSVRPGYVTPTGCEQRTVCTAAIGVR